MNMIWITTRFEGFHCYPDAPKEVIYLRNSHRHIFHIKIWIEIFHDNRDIEFILFKKFVNKIIKQNDFDFMSCEMISDLLYRTVTIEYPKREVWIEVSEDMENGSFKKYKIIEGGKENGNTM